DSPLEFRLYTHNIRYDNKNLWEGERPWSERKYLIASSIKFNAKKNTLVCLQEVLYNQLVDLKQLLGDEWNYFGVGRKDGKFSGEFNPIFYQKKDWKILNSKTFWLSQTPEIPSKGWDAALERIVEWLHLQNIPSNKKINIFNTHLDHQGVIARRESVKLILQRCKNLNNNPSFFTGDFNTEPADEPYQIASKQLLDTNKAVNDKLNRYAHADESTYTGFDGGIVERAKVIDYIWATKDSKNIFIKSFAVLHSKFNFYMSDHRPVSSDIILYDD
ncbi:endonuclease/exonuclease/phosphatase family protein, partial [Ascoidea rubescens DSM 1968]